MPENKKNTGETIYVDPAKIAIFEESIKHFNNSIRKVCENINEILKNPGISNERISDNILEIKNKIEKITADWDSLSKKITQNLSISLETINREGSDLAQGTEI